MFKERLSRNRAINSPERAINADVPLVDNVEKVGILWRGLEKVALGIAAFQELGMPKEKKSAPGLNLGHVPASQIIEDLNADVVEAATLHDPIRIRRIR